MAQQTGTAFKVYLTGGQVAYLTSNSFGITPNMIDVTNKESGANKEVIPGLREYSGNAEGFVEYIGRNILLYSQLFSNAAWDKVSVTFTNENATDPIGGNTASTMAYNADDDAIRQQIVTAVADGDVYIASIWLKAASAGTIDLILRSDDESQGTTVTCSVTTSWQRFSVAYTFSGAEAGVEMLLIRNTGNTLSSVIAWGAQLELGSATNTLPTTYQPTPRKNYSDLFTAIEAGTAYTALMSSKTTGQDNYTGTVYLSNLNLTAANEEAITFQCDFAFTGSITTNA